MKNILTVLAVATTLTSCNGANNLSKREVIAPGAPLNLPFRSDKTTLRACNKLSDTNPIDAVNRNTAICKASIASTAFNAIEDCCIAYVADYKTKKAFIEHFSVNIIKEHLADAKIVYTKTTVSEDKTYTSVLTMELKKEPLLNQLKELFVENGIIDTADADAFIKTIDNTLTPQL